MEYQVLIWRYLLEQYRSWPWMVSSLDRAMILWRYRNNRSMQHGRWWYLELIHWNHGIIQQHHRSWRSSWYNRSNRCIDVQHPWHQHQHPNEYGRNPMDRRNRGKWLQRHHRIPSFQRSNARIVFFGQHHPKRFVCRHPWRRSWELGLGNIWWR